MTDWTKLKIPAKEHINVQILDSNTHHILQVITSKVRDIQPGRTFYTFKLYDVNADGTLALLEKNDEEPKFTKERYS